MNGKGIQILVEKEDKELSSRANLLKYQLEQEGYKVKIKKV